MGNKIVDTVFFNGEVDKDEDDKREIGDKDEEEAVQIRGTFGGFGLLKLS